MSFMEKFQNSIEKVLVPIASKLNAQRHICAVRDAFILSFPLTMAGSLIVLLNNVFLSADGFMFKILQFGKLFPDIVKLQSVFAPVAVSYTHLTLPTKNSPCRSRWSPYH